MRLRVALVALPLLLPTMTRAQETRPSPLAVDTVVAFDEAVPDDGSASWGMTLDAVASIELGGRIQAVVRPFAQRLPTGEWNRQVWTAMLRYERRGLVSARVDAGYIAAPVGLAMLTIRPQDNPTIRVPSSLFVPLPPPAAGTPTPRLLGALYPLGATVTLSGARWDVRAAVMDSSPLRPRRVFSDRNPPRFANLVLGGGVSPVVGLRIGASVTRGGWASAAETRAAMPLDATVYTIEGEYAFAYTKISGEWTRDVMETGARNVLATGWFLQGLHTLTPRWFAAGRVERIRTSVIDDPGVSHRFTGAELVLGYRATPEVTLRGGYRAHRPFGASTAVHTFETSIVWARRWW